MKFNSIAALPTFISFTAGLILAFASHDSFADAALHQEGMHHMPIGEKKREFTVKGDEDFESTQGFGEEEPMVKMMTLMMVGGSGYEGMDMSGMDAKSTSATIAKNDAKPGSKMDGMDMASSREARKASPAKTLEACLSPNPPKVGSNLLEIKAKPGLKLHGRVSMTSMDMGTEEPVAKEVKPGVYRLKVSFSMKGPWEVKVLDASNPESSLPIATYNFNVGDTKPWSPNSQ